MRLVRNGGIVGDDYRRVPDDAPLPDEGAVLVTAARLFAEADWNVEEETCREREEDEELPWEGINLGVSKRYLLAEKKRAVEGTLTQPCSVQCAHICGVCSKDLRPGELPAGAAQIAELQQTAARESESREHGSLSRESRRVLFAFQKTGRAVFWGHLE